MNTHYTTFSVRLWNDYDEIRNFDEKLMDRLVKWYDELVKDVPEILGLNIYNIYVKSVGTKIRISCQAENLELFRDHLTPFVDPDTDGNYPIEINNQEYLIAGNMHEAIKNLV